MRSEVLAEDWRRVWVQATGLAGPARPGHILGVRAARSSFDPLLREPLAIAGVTAGNLTFVLPPASGRWLPQHSGEAVDLLGPIGKGWQLHARARNVVLVGVDLQVAPLLFMAEVAARHGCNVSLLVGATTGRPALPPALAPAAVEYQWGHGDDAAAAALDLLDGSLVGWADAIYTTLPVSSFAALGDRIRRGRVRWLPEFAQGWVAAPMACFVGICDACLAPEAQRPWRACVDGPACDLRVFVRA